MRKYKNVKLINCHVSIRIFSNFHIRFIFYTFTALKKFLMASTSDMRTGLILKIDGSLYTVIEFGQNKTARAAAKVWAKLKGVDNNRTIEQTWNSGETIYPVRVEKKPYQFLYKDDTGYTFMDTTTYEQISVAPEMVDAPQFLKDGQEVSVLINGETDQPMGVELTGQNCCDGDL